MGKMVCILLSSTTLNLYLTLKIGSPVCRKEVLNSVLKNPNMQHDERSLVIDGRDKIPRAPLKPQPKPKSSGQHESVIPLTETSINNEFEVSSTDIAVFKRVVQQIIHSDKPLTRLRNANSLDSPTVTQTRASSTISTNSSLEFRQTLYKDYHPKVAEYLSKLRDKGLLSERIDELVSEKAALEVERDARLRIGFTLDPDDEVFLEEVDTVLDGLAEKLEHLEREEADMRQECFAWGLVFEDGEPTSFQYQEQLAFNHEEDMRLNTNDHASDYIKYPLLLRHPGVGFNNLFDPKLNKELDETTYRINQWMLLQLRSSPLDVNLLARTFEGIVGKTQDDWQTAVLKLWHEDGAGAEQSF
jgi:hypothetical protein